MIALRNVLIIALLALAITVLPGGGNFTTGLLTALSLVFLAAIGFFVARIWTSTEFTRDVMTDRQRYVFYGALGVLALMVAGTDELFASGPGTLLWIAAVGGSIWALVATWREASA
jgi:hypothetical protein